MHQDILSKHAAPVLAALEIEKKGLSGRVSSLRTSFWKPVEAEGKSKSKCPFQRI